MLKRIITFRTTVVDVGSRSEEAGLKRRRQRQGRRTSSSVQYELVLELASPTSRVISLPKPEDFHGMAITYIVHQGAHVVMPRFAAHDDQATFVTQVDGPRIQLRARTATLRWFEYEAKTVECPTTIGEIAAGRRALFIFEGGAAFSFDARSYAQLGMPRPCNNEKVFAITIAR